MTPLNAISGFRATGVFPLDRSVIKLPNCEFEDESEDDDVGENIDLVALAQKNGLAYLPLYSPAPKSKVYYDNFTDEELSRFERRYDNGYDIYDDPRYLKWIEIHHPEFNLPTRNQHPNPELQLDEASSVISEFLKSPTLPHKNRENAGAARVLTSVENIANMLEKLKKKEEIEQLKKTKREERLKKAEQRKQEKLRKSLNKKKKSVTTIADSYYDDLDWNLESETPARRTKTSGLPDSDEVDDFEENDDSKDDNDSEGDSDSEHDNDSEDEPRTRCRKTLSKKSVVNDEYSDENSSLVQRKSMCSGQGSGATRNAGGIIDNLSDKVQKPRTGSKKTVSKINNDGYSDDLVQGKSMSTRGRRTTRKTEGVVDTVSTKGRKTTKNGGVLDSDSNHKCFMQKPRTRKTVSKKSVVNDDENSSLVQRKSMCTRATTNAGSIVDNLSDKVQKPRTGSKKTVSKKDVINNDECSDDRRRRSCLHAEYVYY